MVSSPQHLAGHVYSGGGYHGDAVNDEEGSEADFVAALIKVLSE